MSRSRFPYDAALVMQAYGTAAVTADGASNGLELQRNAHHSLPAGIAYGQFAVVLDVLALDETTGDETYVVNVEVGTDATFATKATVHSFTVDATGARSVILDTVDIEKALSGAKFIRTAVDVGGTTPSITYASYVCPDPQ